MSALSANGATLDLPLLEHLHELDAHIRQHVDLPRYCDPGVGAVGLILKPQLENGGYWSSPLNGLTFASTGGDGDHFSLLIRDGKISDKSPVVLTWPDDGTQLIVGESLHDFLCFGLNGGYFQVLPSVDDVPPEDQDGLWFFPRVEDSHRKVLTLMAKELKLEPWPWLERAARFRSLQSRFLAQVEVGEEPE